MEVGLIEGEKFCCRQIVNDRNSKFEMIAREWTVFKNEIKRRTLGVSY